MATQIFINIEFHFFFRSSKDTCIRNPNTSENLHRIESGGYTAARSMSVTFHESIHQNVFIF